jgi:hypothetical protein
VRKQIYPSDLTDNQQMPKEEKEIERVKQSINLAEVIRSRGVTLKKKGRQLWGLCPFHSDSEPSFAVDECKGGNLFNRKRAVVRTALFC